MADFSTGTASDEQITSIGIAPSRLYIGTKDCRFFALQQAADGSWTQSENAELPFRDVNIPVADIAISPGDADKVWIALGSKHDGTQSAFTVPDGIAGRILRRDGGWDDPNSKWTVLNLPSDTNPVGGKASLPNNPANSIAVDPANSTNLYAGCDVGVFRSTDSGDTWQWWNENLPNVVVSRFVIHKDPHLIRAVTLGRGVWERPLDTVAAQDADIYLRDNALDIGRSPTREGPNPFDPKRQETVFTGAGIKTDNDSFRFLPPFTGGFNKLPSTVDYTPNGNLDYIGFHDFKSVGPRHGADNRIFLEVNNRGPKTATNTKARLFFAAKDEGTAFGDLPPDFWAKFPDNDPADTSTWKPMAPAQTIAALRPAEPVILTFSWSPPRQSRPHRDSGCRHLAR